MKEDIYFYLDLTKDLLKKKEIIKAIKYYIEEKNKINIKSHYSLLIFQEEGNPIFIKTCTGCNKKFPATKKYFYKEGNSDGLRAKCKECTRGYNKL